MSLFTFSGKAIKPTNGRSNKIDARSAIKDNGKSKKFERDSGIYNNVDIEEVPEKANYGSRTTKTKRTPKRDKNKKQDKEKKGKTGTRSNR